MEIADASLEAPVWGGADLLILQHWLLIFGAVSGKLRLMVADFVEWLVNNRPPWAACQELMSGRLIELENKTGVRPVGVSETWHRLISKCFLQVTGQ